MGYLDDEGRIDEKGRSIPPAGLSAQEEARWWLAHPEDLHIACMVKLIPPDIWSAIEIQVKDNELANNLYEKSYRLTIEERGRLIDLLTGREGAALSIKEKGRRTDFRRNIKIAIEISGVEDPAKRNNIVREMAGNPTKKGKEKGDKYSAEGQNISKILKEINKLTTKWSPEEMAIAWYALESKPEWKPTEAELDFAIQLIKRTIDHIDELEQKI